MLTISASPFGFRARHRGSSPSRYHREQQRGDDAAETGTNPLARPVSYPSALPCPYLYTLYPDEIGPTANVVLSGKEEEEVAKWLLVARPVSSEEAERDGGCLIVAPAATDGLPMYYCLTDSDDSVYGRAAYIPREETVGWKRVDTFVEATDASSGCDLGCTDASQCASESCTPTESLPLMCLETEEREKQRCKMIFQYL